MKTLFAVAIILLILVGTILFAGNIFTKTSLTGLFSKNKKLSSITFKGKTYQLMIANTEKEKQTGLSGRDTIPTTTGMLFPFNKDAYWAFWMKNMRFSIDIIYLNNKKVVTIYQDVPYPTLPTKTLPIYTPKEPADTVLELKAGETKNMGLQIGDTLPISL